MNVDEAIEEARQFGEQEPKDMLFAEHIAILLADEVKRLRAELAAAKAASVVPVEIEEVRLPTISQKPYDTVIATKTFGDMCRFRNWLRDRMKERGEW